MENIIKEVLICMLFENNNKSWFSTTKVQTDIPSTKYQVEFLTKAKKKVNNLQQVAFIYPDTQNYYFIDGSVVKEIEVKNFTEALKKNNAPNFVTFCEGYYERLNINDYIKKQYEECSILNSYPNLIFEKILPINEDELSIAKFFKFIIDELNINFHPDDKFEDYLRDGKITNKNGKEIEFDYVSSEYFESQIGLSYEYMGDKIYDIGLDILNTSITKTTATEITFEEDSDERNPKKMNHIQ